MSRESDHYPFRLVIFGKYHFEKPITLFPIVLPALLRWRFFPLAFARAIFASGRPSLYGISQQHESTKVIPKTAQVTQLPVGKKVGPGLTIRINAAKGNADPGNGLTPISFGELRRREGLKEEEIEREANNIRDEYL